MVSSKWFRYGALLAIITLGTFFRIRHISPFKIYPDAYQNLLVAQNLNTTGAVFGTLGTNGLPYPPFVAWTRPGYPLLISSLQGMGADASAAAVAISLIAGVLAIPMVYLFIHSVFRSYSLALSGALLLAYSWNHVVWGGFIGTETLGVFTILLLLTVVFRTLHQRSSWAALPDFLIGILFSATILVRYEYAFLVFPVFFHIALFATTPVRKIINITAILLFVLAIVGATILPLASVIPALNQIKTLLLISALTGMVLAMFLLLRRFSRRSWSLPAQGILSKGSVGIVSFYLLMRIVFPTVTMPFHYHLAGIVDFFREDVLLGVTVLVGLYELLNNRRWHHLTFLVISSIVGLALIYYQVNPLMQRYWTHLLPFLLLPASIGLRQLISLAGKTPVGVGYAGLFLLLWYQGVQTFTGIQQWKQGAYLRISYEEKAAQILKSSLAPTDLLVVSLPEPYYFFTRLPTQSIADVYPFLFAEDIAPEQSVVIVQDAGMRYHFPSFSTFLDREMQTVKQHQFWVGEAYAVQERFEPETIPIVIYTTTWGELKNKLLP